MDRTAWIGILLALAGLIAWQTYYQRDYDRRLAEYKAAQQAQAAAAQAANPVASPAAPSATPPPPELTAGQPQLKPAPVEENVPEAVHSVHASAAEFVFTNLGGGIKEIVLHEHFVDSKDSRPVTLNAGDKLPIGFVSEIPGDTVRVPYTLVPSSEPGVVQYERTSATGLRILKTFRIDQGDTIENQYRFSFELSLQNTSDQVLNSPALYVNLGAAEQIHPRDRTEYTSLMWRGDKKKSVNVNWFPAKYFPILRFQTSGAKSSYQQQATNLKWAAVMNQYFATIATLKEPAEVTVWGRPYEVTFPGEDEKFSGIQTALGFPSYQLAAGALQNYAFDFYAGPKQHRRVSKLGADQEEVMNYGFFKVFSLALLGSMNLLHKLVHNYALAILLLTILIKTLLWPLQNAATKSMRKMSALSPKMTELREKYKDDPTRMNQELMKLYKDYGVNPFGGCLPMLVQIPIFFGFYTMLGSAVELRNSSFLWVQDLSQPDTVLHIGSFPLNILPLLMAATMLWQMSLTPKTTDAVQQRMFMFMPLIFVLFCYNFASALALYWTAQNLFSVVQLYLTRDKPIPPLKKVEKPAPITGRKKGKQRS
jgi:YidC/Oxa1 family membrane protein insertase